MLPRQFASQKALLDYAEQKGLVYMWAYTQREGITSTATALSSRNSTPHRRRLGVYEVTKPSPESNGEFEYRIKSVNEPHERVVWESELQGV